MTTAFITGCGSGFGRALARRLLAQGWRVVATDPKVQGLEDRLDPDGAHKDSLLPLRLDLRDGPGLRAAVRDALDWSAVDLLVNNGGYAVFGSQEEADLDAVRALFDVNVLGLARVTQALLPSLRAQRGTVVNISSVAGRMTFPESGFYAATKHAVEALSEALFIETATFGMRVRVVEPGSFDTNFLQTAAGASKPRSPASPYAHLHRTWDARKTAMLEPPQAPELVVDAILESLADPTPFRRIAVGPDAERLMGMRDRLSPDGWVELMARRNGLWPLASVDGGVLTASEVCALPGNAPYEAVANTLAAYRAGYLDHWGEDLESQTALEILAIWDTAR